MRLLCVVGAHVVAFAMLVGAFAGLASPEPDYADTRIQHIGTVATLEYQGAAVHLQTQGADIDHRCHPDLDCSPTAVLTSRPMSRAHPVPGERLSLETPTLIGRPEPVDPPPPRNGRTA